jgi:uncharacterized membrane protein YraQ (UPF0718 family)
MAPGAALAFVTAAAVSSVLAAMAVYALVKRSIFCIYIGLGLLGSMIAGYMYQVFHYIECDDWICCLNYTSILHPRGSPGVVRLILCALGK